MTAVDDLAPDPHDPDLERADDVIASWQERPRTALQDLLISQLRTLRTRVARESGDIATAHARLAELQQSGTRRRYQLRAVCDALGDENPGDRVIVRS